MGLVRLRVVLHLVSSGSDCCIPLCTKIAVVPLWPPLKPPAAAPGRGVRHAVSTVVRVSFVRVTEVTVVDPSGFEGDYG